MPPNDVIIIHMQTRQGLVKELRLDGNGRTVAWIECPAHHRPQAGQYLMGWAPADGEASLATPLFPAMLEADGFLAAAPLPPSWEPGTRLQLRGPMGHGFQIPPSARHLALGTIGVPLDRLLPLMQAGLQRELAVTLYIDNPPTNLPSAVEIYPLASLPEALAWADILALDLERQELPRLRSLLGSLREYAPSCPVQALVRTCLPCGGVAECGACAVPGRKRWKAACTQGPVFDLRELDW
jgi:dihydroorotate dehydrogenase electron transfer subunit